MEKYKGYVQTESHRQRPHGELGWELFSCSVAGITTQKFALSLQATSTVAINCVYKFSLELKHLQLF